MKGAGNILRTFYQIVLFVVIPDMRSNIFWELVFCEVSVTFG